MKSRLLLILILASAFTVNSQKIKLLIANQQDWAGGIAGHHGTNYYIQLETTDYAVTPDTVWIQNMPYPANFSDSLHGFKRKVDNVHHKVTYSIAVGESYNDMTQTSSHPKCVPSKKYDGVALVAYKYKGKQRSFIIKQLNTLQTLDYP